VILEHAQVMNRQNVRYAEISFNPSLHVGESWLAGIVAGRERAKAELDVEIAWLVELVRGAPDEVNQRALDVALSTIGVVGAGLVGDESIPSTSLKPLIERAREAGIGFMPHAGQAGGPDAVREAIDELGATRIAHGVAAIADAPLMRSLAELDVCLCVCPSSNRRIGLTPDYGALAAAGIPLTVNTDDPAMVPATLTEELELAVKDYGLDREQLVAASWRYRFMRGALRPE
jgi:aminodeoxyfutalosine deaminase